MSIDPFDDSVTNPQQLGAISGPGVTLSGTGMTKLDIDPVDYYRVTTEASIGSLALTFGMTTDLAGLSRYVQFITLIPISGFVDEETINFAIGSGEFDTDLIGGDFTEGLGTSSPIEVEIEAGADVVFSLQAGGYDYDNGTEIDISNLPNAPSIPGLPSTVQTIPDIVAIDFDLSVAAGSSSGSGGGSGGGGTGGGGGGGTPTSNANVFDLVDAFSAAALANLRDFDGNALGAVEAWTEIGRVDVEGDGDIEVIMINELIGRWATLGISADDTVDFSAYGQGGDTRVVGIYIDPLVANGTNVLGGPFDSQTRFANDIETGNLGAVLGAADYDGDGFQEVYFALNDGSAVLHAYMHADGNISYANYQSEADLDTFMQANGVNASVYDSWF